MQSATKRDRLSAELNRVLYFKIEVVELINSFLCLVIYSIYNYANLYKNKQQQLYIVAIVVAYAKKVLLVILLVDVAKSRTVEKIIREASSQCSSSYVYSCILALILYSSSNLLYSISLELILCQTLRRAPRTLVEANSRLKVLEAVYYRAQQNK